MTAEPTDRRELIAAAARSVPLRLGPNAVAMAQRGEPIILNLNEADALADAVLAVRPEPADRAAVLREAEQAVRTAASNCAYASDAGCEFCTGVDAALEHLRRLADEAQQPEATCPGYETAPNRCQCPCEGCRHNCAAHHPEGAQR